MKPAHNLATRAVEYIHSHPGSSALEVARAIGNKSYPSVSVALNRAAQRGQIAANMEAGQGRRGAPRRFYPPHQHTTTSFILRHAREIGGHFGILAAQIMHGPSH